MAKCYWWFEIIIFLKTVFFKTVLLQFSSGIKFTQISVGNLVVVMAVIFFWGKGADRWFFSLQWNLSWVSVKADILSAHCLFSEQIAPRSTEYSSAESRERKLMQEIIVNFCNILLHKRPNASSYFEKSYSMVWCESMKNARRQNNRIARFNRYPYPFIL